MELISWRTHDIRNPINSQSAPGRAHPIFPTRKAQHDFAEKPNKSLATKAVESFLEAKLINNSAFTKRHVRCGTAPMRAHTHQQDLHVPSTSPQTEGGTNTWELWEWGPP